MYATFKSKKQAVPALFSGNGWKMNPKMLQDYPPLDDATVETFVTKCRDALRLETDEDISSSWLSNKNNLFKMLSFRMMALKELQLLKKKTYNILPIARIKRHFITLDTMGFWGLCVDCKLLSCSIYDEQKKTNPLIKSLDQKPLLELSAQTALS